MNKRDELIEVIVKKLEADWEISRAMEGSKWPPMIVSDALKAIEDAGYVFVPRELTDEQCFGIPDYDFAVSNASVKAAWRSMIDAAQKESNDD